MKKVTFVLVVLLAVLPASCSTAYKSLTAKMPDLQLIADGVYNGEYNLSSTPIKVTLEVTVLNRQITKINMIKHICSPIGKKAERIIDQVITAQSLDVDVVSGATGSSKAILKAVENALQ